MSDSRLRIAVIAAHPRRRSFTISAAEAFAEAARDAGADVVLRDLYRLRFDPRLAAREMPDHPHFAPGPDVVRERTLIGGADVFAFFYPLWFNSTPAMMKGYVDRVFGMGFGYSPMTLKGNQPLLKGRAMITFTSSGAPQEWVEQSGAWAAMREHFDAHFAAVTGLDILGRQNFGGIGPGADRSTVREHLAEVRQRAVQIVESY